MNNKYIEINDIAYGKHERQRLDIFIPESKKSETGIILFIHGGGWSDGDKSEHKSDAHFFCNLGYICASMNYRFVSDEISVFDELDDITSALKSIKIKCKEYGLTVSKLILSGTSAGSHLSLMYAYTRLNEAPITPVATCVYCPPVSCSEPDFLFGISSEFDDWKYGLLSKCCRYKITKETFKNLNEQTALNRISPSEFVNSNCVPTAVFHGNFDELIPFKHIKNFMNKLSKSNVPNDLLILENSYHDMKNDPETELIAKGIFIKYIKKYF